MSLQGPRQKQNHNVQCEQINPACLDWPSALCGGSSGQQTPHLCPLKNSEANQPPTAPPGSLPLSDFKIHLLFFLACCTSSCYDLGTPCNTITTSISKSWYSEAEGMLPNDFLLFPVKLAFYKAVTPEWLDKACGQILDGLPCCAPAKDGRVRKLG